MTCGVTIWEIIWTGELPQLSKLPHPPGVSHLRFEDAKATRTWFSGKNKNLALWRPQTSEDEILFLFVNFDFVPRNSTPGGLPTVEKVSG